MHADTQSLLTRARELEHELEQTRRLLAGLPSQATRSATLNVVTFSVADLKFAVPVTHVDEVVPSARLLHVPRAPGFIPGALEIDAELVPILDLGLYMGRTAHNTALDDSLVLCSVEGHRLGLCAISLPTLVEVDAALVSAPPSEYAGAPYVVAWLASGDEPILLLGMLSLLMTARLPEVLS